MITITLTETDYFLPEDGNTAKRQFLGLLNQLSEVWLSAFGFTLQPMFDELKQADASGARIHSCSTTANPSGRPRPRGSRTSQPASCTAT